MGEKDNSAGDIEGATAEERLRESKKFNFYLPGKEEMLGYYHSPTFKIKIMR